MCVWLCVFVHSTQTRHSILYEYLFYPYVGVCVHSTYLCTRCQVVLWLFGSSRDVFVGTNTELSIYFAVLVYIFGSRDMNVFELNCMFVGAEDKLIFRVCWAKVKWEFTHTRTLAHTNRLSSTRSFKCKLALRLKRCFWWTFCCCCVHYYYSEHFTLRDNQSLNMIGRCQIDRTAV